MAIENVALGKASTFSIAELTSDGAARLPNGYTVLLAGRALPHRPYEISGDMRAEFTEYPGNPISTAQMLGAKENETTIRGWWKDRFIKPLTELGNPVPGGPQGIAQVQGVQVEDVMALAKLIDRIRRRGQLLEVAWDEIIRHGIMTRFVQKWDRREDLEFEVNFRWISQGEKQAPVAFNVEYSRADLEASLSNGLSALMDTLTPAFKVAEALQNDLTVITGKIQSAISDIGNASLTLINLAVSPANAARRTLAALQQVQDQCSAIAELVESTPPQLFVSTASSDPNPYAIGFGQTLAAAEYGRRLRTNARSLASLSADQGDQLRNRIDTQNILAVFQARNNMDLRDVSNRFYGTQEQWKQLMQYNGFQTSKLVAGDTVFVPRLRTPGT